MTLHHKTSLYIDFEMYTDLNNAEYFDIKMKTVVKKGRSGFLKLLNVMVAILRKKPWKIFFVIFLINGGLNESNFKGLLFMSYQK